MDADIATVLISSVASIFLGGVSAIWGPWAQWKIDQQRLLRADRKEKIARWRDGLLGIDVPAGRLYEAVRASPLLEEMWDVLLPAERDILFGQAVVIDIDGAGMPANLRVALIAIARMEREWKLI